jgi:glycosyltransferase involved in cell wall biosynthesis
VAERPLVSVVIPTYNNARFVREAVDSVLAQTWQPIEAVVVDDGSTDNTAEVLAGLGDSVKVIRQENQGPAVARNTGIRNAGGSIIAFLDSDDLYMPEKIALCVAALEQRPELGVAYTAIRVREMDTGIVYLQDQYTHGGDLSRDLFTECKGVNTSSLVVKRSYLDQVGGFDEEFFRCQDWDLMVRLAEVCEYVHVPEVLTERRLHSGSISVTHAHLYKKFNLLVLNKALERRPDLYESLGNHALAQAHLRFGLGHYGAFRLREARAEFRNSLKHEWTWWAFNYLLRAYLPGWAVRGLRSLRMIFRKRECKKMVGEGGDG